MNWKLKSTKQVIGKIRIVTGLHIGGSKELMEIGGVDNPIIKNPADNSPYIPGSSLKGKMRSLMEWKLGLLSANGKPFTSDNPECRITRVFGGMAGANKSGPTRLVVRDCFLADESRKAFAEGQELTEIKHENWIDRITSEATPRPLERVIPGVAFDLNLVYKVLDTGDGGALDEQYFTEVVLRALALVQDDFLGGSGSRGCGRIRFEDLKDENGNPLQLPEV